MEVKVNELVYKILAADLEPLNPETQSLKLTIRCTNTNPRYDAVLAGSSLRLLIEDVPRAPTNNFYEVVSNQSALEGEFVFEVPTTVSTVVLQISDDTSEAIGQIPIQLSSANP
ncbi:hypothetical protein C7271_11345 [filamentous cyanobacterium CCP5]|nr:hypothetical protein C7271_11345 [filamentous cyanobacterium CCP5]